MASEVVELPREMSFEGLSSGESMLENFETLEKNRFRVPIYLFMSVATLEKKRVFVACKKQLF